MADPKSWNPWHGCRRYSEGFGGDRPCHYEWIRRVSDDCTKYRVNFTVNAIGSHFVKDGRMHLIDSQQERGRQTYRSGLSRFFSKPTPMNVTRN